MDNNKIAKELIKLARNVSSRHEILEEVKKAIVDDCKEKLIKVIEDIKIVDYLKRFEKQDYSKREIESTYDKVVAEVEQDIMGTVERLNLI